MFSQWRFYFDHAFNDLRVNGQRTFFALLCIAAGVAAIVSLQTLAVMIEDTLTTNLQANNRGDLQLELRANFGDAAETDLDQGVSDGYLTREAGGLFGFGGANYYLSAEGFDRLRLWFEQNYPNQVAITTVPELTDTASLFLGGGTGTTLNAIDQATAASGVTPRLIDPSLYPFYAEVRSQDGQLLRDLLIEPTDLVLDQKSAQMLNVAVGEQVRISGANVDFTVRGIVPTAAEITDIGDSFLISQNGFYYLRQEAFSLFADATFKSDLIYVRVNDPALIEPLTTEIDAIFPYFETTNTLDLQADNEQLTTTIDQLVTIMGLVSMLLGSVGIVNTMQVIVQRRTLEIAVLKTLGLQGSQVTTLFLVEALIMGVFGALIGVVLGWLTTFVIKSAAEQFFAQELAFRIALAPAVNGMIVGVIVTTIFGFLPTLSASLIRPALVLRPSDQLIPRAGCLRLIGAFAVVLIALILVAQGLLGNFNLALIAVIGTFIVAGVLYLLLNLLITLIGRFFPRLGLIDLKLSLRQMLATRQRNAITLLALVVGVFSLSLMTLYAQAVSNVLNFSLSGSGDLLIITLDATQTDAIEQILQADANVTDYRVLRTYDGEFVSLERADGTTLDRAAMLSFLQEVTADQPRFGPNGDGENEFVFEEVILDVLGSITAINSTAIQDETMISGRNLTPDDSAIVPLVVRQTGFIEDVRFAVGDRITYTFGAESITFEVIGVSAAAITAGFSAANLTTLYQSLPEGLVSLNQQVLVFIDEANVPALRRELSQLPGVFVVETAAFASFIENIFATFSAFPTMVALLGLIVGGVVIANGNRSRS
ncbi:MAG: ABC transporter permease [Anaerolineae bacterium]|nr:ABC transporter permease [Anaerolineae bacterium]